MYLSPCASYLSVNRYTFVVCLIFFVTTNQHVSATTTYDVEFEKRPRRYAFLDKVKTHHCKYIHDFALRADCEWWSCWESQMRDFTRIEFLRIYNNYRTEILKKKCPNCRNNEIPMIQLEWHWRVEKESQKAIQKCPFKNFQTDLIIDVRDGDEMGANLMVCEMVATSFPVQSGSQNELLHMLPYLLNNNYLNDMDEHEEYRRNLALYIGCSYISRVLDPGHIYVENPTLKGAIGHLVCFYCSKENTMRSNNTVTTCPKYTNKSETNEFPELCKLVENKIVMPCETRNVPCVSWKKTYSWMLTNVFDIVAEFDNGTSMLTAEYIKNLNVAPPAPPKRKKKVTPAPIIVIVTPYMVSLDQYDFKFCIISLLVYVLVLSLMAVSILLIYKFYLMSNSKTDTK